MILMCCLSVVIGEPGSLQTLQRAGEAVAKTIQDRKHSSVSVSEVKLDTAKVLPLQLWSTIAPIFHVA